MKKVANVEKDTLRFTSVCLYDYAATGSSVQFMTLFNRVLKKQLLPKGNNPQDNYGYTYLHYAAANGHLEIVQFLINSSENKGVLHFNIRINDTSLLNETAVLLAVKSDHFEVAKFLLEHGANPSILDIYGATCWDYAQVNENKRLLNILSRVTSSNASKEECSVSLHLSRFTFNQQL